MTPPKSKVPTVSSCALDLDGRIDLAEGQVPAAVADDVDIGQGLEAVRQLGGHGVGVRNVGGAQAGPQRPAGGSLGSELRRPHDPVAVADPALVEPDPVDHPVSVEGIGVAAERRVQRVGPIAKVGAGQAVRQGTFHDEISGVVLLGHRGEDTAQGRVGGRIHGQRDGRRRHVQAWLSGHRAAEE